MAVRAVPQGGTAAQGGRETEVRTMSETTMAAADTARSAGGGRAARRRARAAEAAGAGTVTAVRDGGPGALHRGDRDTVVTARTVATAAAGRAVVALALAGRTAEAARVAVALAAVARVAVTAEAA